MPELKNPKHEAFAKLVASGLAASNAYTEAGYIAKNEATAYACASRLLSDAKVAARVAELRPAHEQILKNHVQEIVDDEIRTVTGRVKALCERRRKLYDVIAARAEFPEHQDMPGGNTGLVVTSYRAVGREKHKTHEVDLNLLRELRETEKQIAQELGQWIDKSDNRHTFKSLDELTDEQLIQLAQDAAQQHGVAQLAPRETIQ